jgi:hypothetical protein
VLFQLVSDLSVLGILNLCKLFVFFRLCFGTNGSFSCLDISIKFLLFFDPLLVKFTVHIKLSFLVLAKHLIELLLTAGSLQLFFIVSQSVQLVDSQVVFDLLFLLRFIGLDLVKFLVHDLLNFSKLFVLKLGGLCFGFVDDLLKVS